MKIHTAHRFFLHKKKGTAVLFMIAVFILLSGSAARCTPMQFNWDPADNATISTTDPIMTFETDMNAACRWDAVDLGYNDMVQDCIGAGSMSHMCSIFGLVEGTNNVFISCDDLMGDPDTNLTNTQLTYTVSLPSSSLNYGTIDGSPVSWTSYGASVFTESGGILHSDNPNYYSSSFISDSAFGPGSGDFVVEWEALCVAGGGYGTFGWDFDESSLNTGECQWCNGSKTMVMHGGWGGAYTAITSGLNATSTTFVTTPCDSSYKTYKFVVVQNGGAFIFQDGVMQTYSPDNLGPLSRKFSINTQGDWDQYLWRGFTGNTSAMPTPLVINPTELQFYMSPGGSAMITGTITGNTGAASWRVDVLDAGNLILKTYMGSGTSISQAWDGKNAAETDQALGDYNARIAAWDTNGNYHVVDVTVSIVPRPVQSNHTPPTDSTVASTAQTITFNTDMNANCRWALSDLDYDSMVSDCSGSETAIQSCAVTGLTQGSNDIYLACDGLTNNKDTAASNTNIRYFMDNVPPVQSNHNPAGGSTLASNSQVITLTIDESGDCKWALTDLPFSGMTNTCDNTSATQKSCSITGLAEGTNTASITCSDTFGNADDANTNTDLSYNVQTVAPDTTPPVQSNHSPADGSALNTTSQAISFTLDETGSCKWALSDLSYDSMTNTCTGGGSTSQSCSVSGLAEGANTIYIACADTASNKDTTTTNTQLSFTVDTSAPEIAFVYDGTGADTEFSTIAGQLSANWSATARSGVQKYEYAIGTTAGGTDVVNWTNNGTNTSVTKTGLTLTDGKTYYFTVKAYSTTGSTAAKSSNGVKVDTTPATTPVVTDDGATTVVPDKLVFSLKTADPDTGVVKIEYAIGTAADKTDVRGWTNTNVETAVNATELSLSAGTKYYILVRAINAAGLISQTGVSDGITRVTGANVQFSFLPENLNASAGDGTTDISVPLEMIFKETGGATIRYDQMQRTFVLPGGSTSIEPVQPANFTIQQNEELHIKDTSVVIPATVVTRAIGGVAQALITVRMAYKGVDAVGNAIETIIEVPVTMTSSETAVQFELSGAEITSLSEQQSGGVAVIAAAAKLSAKGIGTVSGQWVVNGSPMKNFSIDIMASGDTVLSDTLKPLTAGDKVVLKITSPVYKESAVFTFSGESKASDIKDFWAGPFHVTDLNVATDPGAATISGEGMVKLPLSDTSIKVPLSKILVENKDGKNVLSGITIISNTQNFKIEKGPLSLSVTEAMLKTDGITADGTITIKGGNGVPGIGPMNFFGLKIGADGFSGQIKFDPPQKGKIGILTVSIESLDFALTQSQTDVKVRGMFESDQNGVIYVRLPMVIETLPDGGLKFGSP